MEQHAAPTETDELVRLRRENAELRTKLGLPSKESLRKPIEQELPIFGEGLPNINSKSPANEKIKLFRTLFRGREDVYPVFWINERLGKKGYSPACEQPYASKHQLKKYLPLTDAVVQNHLSGNITIGVFPLLPDYSCFFLACDFDKGSWLLDAIAYVDSCHRYSIPAYLERSRSGQGGHVWIFFSSLVAATQARQLGMRLLRETMESRADLDMESYDRFFPNQDFLPKAGFGNLIALPLQKKCRTLGNTEFLDTSLPEPKPWPDQWAFLSHIRRISPAQLEGLLETVPPIETGPDSAHEIRPGTSPRLPETINATLGSELSIETSGLPTSFRAKLRHIASIPNPEYYKREKLRLSTYQTPRFVRCYREDLSHLHLPRGLADRIGSFVEKSGSTLKLNDRRATFKALKLEFQGLLRPEQERAVDTVLKNDMGVLVAPPGAGKTVMGCAAIARRNVPTLVLAHRKPLLDQWKTQLIALLGLKSKNIGQIGGGQKSQKGIVDLAMIQSLARRDDLPSLFSQYGLIVVDECHHIPALEFERCLRQAPSRYFLGLTATPYRRDGLHQIISMQCGPTRHEIGAYENGLPLKLIVRETAHGYADDVRSPIQDLFKALAEDDVRNSLIAQDVASATGQGRRCMVLTQRTDHCAGLASALSNRGVESTTLNGLQGKKERTALTQAIKEAPIDKPLVVISTGQYLGEGFDCPQMDTLFMAAPASFKGRLVQYVGRIMRNHPEKTDAIVYDYVDSQVDVLKRMYFRRRKTYKELGATEIDA